MLEGQLKDSLKEPGRTSRYQELGLLSWKLNRVTRLSRGLGSGKRVIGYEQMNNTFFKPLEIKAHGLVPFQSHDTFLSMLYL